MTLAPAQFHDAREVVRVDVGALPEWYRQTTSIALLGRRGDLALTRLRAARTAWMGQDVRVASDLERGGDELDGTYRRLVAHLLTRLRSIVTGGPSALAGAVG